MTVTDGLDAATLSGCKIAAEHAEDVDRDNRIPKEALQELRRQGLLSLLVPPSLGGQGRSLTQAGSVCHALAQACGSTAMIFAMHQIQVACIVAHAGQSEWHRALLRRLNDEQLLLGSVTSEAGTGGSIRVSICCVETIGDRIVLDKDATAISYGAHADALLITARRSREAAPSDQVMIVAMHDDYTLERTSEWDALGMRGTCSDGFHLRLSGNAAQIIPVPFANICNHTMLPVSHMLWSSVWLGLAADAVARARRYLRRKLRERGAPSPAAPRLARAVGLVQLMQSRLSSAFKDYESVPAVGTMPTGFTADMNTLKISISEQCLEVVQHAFMICGIDAYKNTNEYSLGRHIRDLLSAPIMINNDRMLDGTGNLLLMQQPALRVL